MIITPQILGLGRDVQAMMLQKTVEADLGSTTYNFQTYQNMCWLSVEKMTFNAWQKPAFVHRWWYKIYIKITCKLHAQPSFQWQQVRWHLSVWSQVQTPGWISKLYRIPPLTFLHPLENLDVHNLTFSLSSLSSLFNWDIDLIADGSSAGFLSSLESKLLKEEKKKQRPVSRRSAAGFHLCESAQENHQVLGVAWNGGQPTLPDWWEIRPFIWIHRQPAWQIQTF